MQAESIDSGAAWTERQIHALRVDLIPNPSHTASGVGAISRSAGHGSGVKPGQPGLISTKGIQLFRSAVRPKATAIGAQEKDIGECSARKHTISVQEAGLMDAGARLVFRDQTQTRRAKSKAFELVIAAPFSRCGRGHATAALELASLVTGIEHARGRAVGASGRKNPA